MKIHMVKSGDTMYTIAQKHGVKLEQLIAYNPQISNPDQIDAGMKVKIPSGAFQDGSTGVEYAHKHTVVQGDSLWKISKAWGLPLKALVEANPQLKNPSVLLTGEVVNIPKHASQTNTMSNPIAPYQMNQANMITPITPNVSNIISPAVTAPTVLPQPPTPPTIKPEMPISQPLTQPSFKEEAMNIHPSETLFKQFDVPAVEVSGKEKQGNTYQQPAYQQPMYQQPAYQQPEMYKQPTYQESAYQQPETYKQPTYQEPAYQQPETYKQPTYQEPTYQEPAYQQPEMYKQPTYQEPAYQQPEMYKQPTYQQPEMYQQSAYQQPEMYQPQPNQPPSYTTATLPEYQPYPTYASKPGCGCGCGEATNIMPYNQFQPTYSTMPSYYIPQPMLGYSNQPPLPFQQNYPTQLQAAESPVSPYGYMVPGYPMGAYGDMSYHYGMQAPYSPWVNSSNNIPPAQSLAESGYEPTSNQQVTGVLGASDQVQDEAPVKKRTKNNQNSANRSSQKQDSVAVLQHFLQKKSTNEESIRENKIKEPWLNR